MSQNVEKISEFRNADSYRKPRHCDRKHAIVTFCHEKGLLFKLRNRKTQSESCCSKVFCQLIGDGFKNVSLDPWDLQTCRVWVLVSTDKQSKKCKGYADFQTNENLLFFSAFFALGSTMNLLPLAVIAFPKSISISFNSASFWAFFSAARRFSWSLEKILKIEIFQRKSYLSPSIDFTTGMNLLFDLCNKFLRFSTFVGLKSLFHKLK